MSSHTPRPWVVLGTQGYEGAADIGDGKGEIIAQVACPSVERRNANTHLIKAAPDLLEAAKGILAVLPTSLAVTEEELEALEPLEVAVKKAEGRA